MVFCNMFGYGFNHYKHCHNPYFNRWFSAIYDLLKTEDFLQGHNPYFNRWFSAIIELLEEMYGECVSQSLF